MSGSESGIGKSTQIHDSLPDTWSIRTNLLFKFAANSERVWYGSIMDPTIKDFESAVTELDAIVKTLEEGDLALEKSLELYERGVQLARFCHSKLEGAERRIELLNERGEIKDAPPALGLGGAPAATK